MKNDDLELPKDTNPLDVSRVLILAVCLLPFAF